MKLILYSIKHPSPAEQVKSSPEDPTAVKAVAVSVIGASRTGIWHSKKSWSSTAAWQSPDVTVLRATGSRLPRLGECDCPYAPVFSL